MHKTWIQFQIPRTSHVNQVQGRKYPLVSHSGGRDRKIKKFKAYSITRSVEPAGNTKDHTLIIRVGGE